MQALGTAANIFGVITPAKDVSEIVKAIADSVDNVKRNKYKISSLIQILKNHVQALHKARERYEVEGGTIRQIESLRQLQTSLFLVWKELAELNQTQSNSGLLGLTFRQWWNASGVKARIEQLEMDIKQCRDLFLFESLDGMRQEVNIIKTILVGNSDVRGSRYEVKRTTIMWKIPMKPDFSDPNIRNYSYLFYNVLDLLNVLKNDGRWIEELLRNNMKNFRIIPGGINRLPIGDPTRECQDASHIAIQLSRPIQDRNSHIPVVEWFDDLYRLGSALSNVGLTKEALQIRQFEYRILTLLDSKQENNLNSDLARCLHNLAVSYFNERRYHEALPLSEKAVEIYRRLGESFIPNLAIALRFLSKCFHILRQFEKSMESLQESIDLFRELALSDLLRYGWQMAYYLNDKAFLHFDLREYQKAIDCSEEANQWLSKCSHQFKEEFPCEYVRVHWTVALAYKELGEFAKAEEYGREATKVSNRLINDRPLLYLQYSVAAELSAWFHEMGRSQDAIYLLDESITIYCSVMPSPAVQQKFADTLYRRSEIQHFDGKFDSALDALAQVIDVRHHLLEGDETNSNCLLSLLSAFRLQSSCLLSLHRPFEAIKSIEMALDVLESSINKVRVKESQIDSILQELRKHELLLKEMSSIQNFDDLRKYRRALIRLEETILELSLRIHPISMDMSESEDYDYLWDDDALIFDGSNVD